MKSISTLTLVALCVLAPLSAVADEAVDPKVNAALHEAADHVAKEVYSLTTYGAFDWITILASPDHSITFSGSIATQNLKPDAETMAKKVKGVDKVINNLYYLGNSSKDRQIRLRAYNAIYETFLPQYSPFMHGERAVGGSNMRSGPHPIHIIVEHGDVTLMGYVYSHADKSHATHAVQTVMGVGDVSNFLAVHPKPKAMASK